MSKVTSPKLLHTVNLGMFKYHDVNRDFTSVVSQNRIKAIAKSMTTEGLFPHPMIVTSKFYVVDGQHRLEAARIANKGIYFIVDESIPNTPKGIFHAAKRFNKNAKVWTKEDYVHGYSSQGNENYVALETFRQKYPMFSLTEALMLLVNSGTKNIEKTTFADGKFEVKNLKKAEAWAQHLISLKPYFEQGYNRSVFVRTILSIMETKKEFNFERFLHKVKLNPGKIKLCGDKKAYSEMIEDIYNYMSRQDDKLNLRF
jgi:hypothetical protein